MPVMTQIGERWHRGKVSTAAEHFASNYLRRKIEALISASARRQDGPLVVLGCAPDDWHELGLLLVYLFLLRRGYNVLYLGQNVPVEQFVDEMRRLSPDLVMISATAEESVPGVIAMAEAIAAMDGPKTGVRVWRRRLQREPASSGRPCPAFSWARTPRLPWRTSGASLRSAASDGWRKGLNELVKVSLTLLTNT